MLIDSHSHIYDQAFDPDRGQVLERAKQAGVTKIILPAIDSESHKAMFEVAKAYPGMCFPAMGLHPTSVNDNPDYRKELELVEKYIANPPEGIEKFYAVGEVGLDLHWSREFIREQMEVFDRQVQVAMEYRLPLIIHTREAWDEMIEVLSQYKGLGIRGVMHAYSGNAEQYRQIKQMGDFKFGVGGVVTYKNSEMPEIVARMEPEDIILETDCPYLTPVPFRGKRNESAYVVYVRDVVAQIFTMPTSEIEKITTRNAEQLFGI